MAYRILQQVQAGQGGSGRVLRLRVAGGGAGCRGECSLATTPRPATRPPHTAALYPVPTPFKVTMLYYIVVTTTA